MKKKILIFLPTIVILAIIIRLILVSFQQKQEFVFHNNLPKTIKLASSDFTQNSIMPIECTGKGNNISPSLNWSNIPQATQSLVLLVTDYDAPASFFKMMTIDHWVVFDINPNISFLKKGTLSTQYPKDSVRFGKNITDGVEYVGPKPPIGTHSYYFRIYALSVSHLNLVNPTKQDVIKAMTGKIHAYGELIGKY